MNVEFAQPYFFYLLIIIPILIWLQIRAKDEGSILYPNLGLIKAAITGRKFSIWKRLHWLKYLALALLIVALARPRVGEGQTQSSGIDIVLAIDISSSMLALDLEKNKQLATRLDVVKDVVDDFIRKRPNDRIGIVAFAKNPYLVSPLTLNHSWLQENVSQLRVGLVADGTAIGSAIAMSVNRFKNIQSKSRIVILLTDGLNNEGKLSPLGAAEAAAAMKVKVYTILAGQGGIVSILQTDATGNIVKDIRGRPYVSQVEVKVDTEVLKKVAEITDAYFYQAKDGSQLRQIYDQIDALEKNTISLEHYTFYYELFYWPAFMALMLILLEKFLTSTRYFTLP
jgi:Ca-activated chloride channel homolog